MKTLVNKAALAAAVILTAIISSCTKDDGNVAQSSIQLVNSSPDAGAANLFVNGGQTTKSTVTYGNASGYSNTLPGSGQPVEIKSASGSTFATTTSSLDAGSNYSVFLVGQASANNLSAVVATDDQTPPASGNVKIRFVNGASVSPGIDLVSGSSVFFAAQSYKTVTAYTEKPAGSYLFKLNLAGTSTTLASMASVSLQSGKFYTIVVNGSTALSTTVIAN